MYRHWFQAGDRLLVAIQDLHRPNTPLLMCDQIHSSNLSNMQVVCALCGGRTGIRWYSTWPTTWVSAATKFRMAQMQIVNDVDLFVISWACTRARRLDHVDLTASKSGKISGQKRWA